MKPETIKNVIPMQDIIEAGYKLKKIIVCSFADFLTAISKASGSDIEFESVEGLAYTGFRGVPVVENKLIPDGMAVLYLTNDKQVYVYFK